MQTYVAEIDGRAVIAFRASNDAEAQMFIPKKLCAQISRCFKTKGVRSGTGKLRSSCANPDSKNPRGAKRYSTVGVCLARPPTFSTQSVIS